MLEVVVFLCGAVVMVVELAASRVLAPALGTSTIVWTSIIGAILGALSLGYWTGGILSDRHPTRKALSLVILASAAATALIGVLRYPIIEFVAGPESGLHVRSLITVILLFGPAATLLGMVTPFAARIRLENPESAGRTVGILYALSTLGSIVGTFAGGFVLISYFGSGTILYLMAAVLAVTSLICHPGLWRAKAAATGLCLAGMVVQLAVARSDAQAGYLDVDTDYQHVQVLPARNFLTGRSMLALKTGPEGFQGGMYPDAPDELALNYTRHLVLASHFVRDMRRVLVLGGGAYSFPRYILQAFPEARVDVVELDPGITALARAHFKLDDDPRLTVIHQDARTFLNMNSAIYDLIVMDVFNSAANIPFHLTTLETAKRLAAALDTDGLMIVNTIVAREGAKSRLYKSFFATYSQAFPRVDALATWPRSDPESPGNVLLFCFKDSLPRDWTSPNPDEAEMLAKRIPAPDLSDALVLTDEFSPVERFMTGW